MLKNNIYKWKVGNSNEMVSLFHVGHNYWHPVIAILTVMIFFKCLRIVMSYEIYFIQKINVSFYELIKIYYQKPW